MSVSKKLRVGRKDYAYYPVAGVAPERLPYSLKILLENMLRHEDGKTVAREDIEALRQWDPKAKPSREIAFRPARVLLQDFTGVPAVVDLAAMREAMLGMGGDPGRINPLQPADLVIDHSVQVDTFGSAGAFGKNVALEYQRNKERYLFLKWGQQAFANFSVVPPGTGIVHQVNLEYLGRVVFQRDGVLYPDTLVGTDSHTTMINGLGVLGWGVGGIEAEAAMLGQPISMLIPQVVGFKLTGRLPEGATATDLVLTATQMLRAHGVVEKFVEFYGPGLCSLSLADRATIANMAPEYGATIGLFPVDNQTLEYLRMSGRDADQVGLVEAYAKEQGMFWTEKSPEPLFSETLRLDLGSVEPSLAGPKRPQDRLALKDAKKNFHQALGGMLPAQAKADAVATVQDNKDRFDLSHGSVVIAAITSCTNTSNPAVMLAAGLLAKKAVERGLRRPPWVKTSLAPGSKVVMDYLTKAGLLKYLEQLNFYLVGYGCTTCIGNSGPLPEKVAEAVKDKKLVVASVLSGNRNFEGRINSQVRANYLMSPPLVVAYALSGTMNRDLQSEPLGKDKQGKDVYLKDIWPSVAEVNKALRSVTGKMFAKRYAKVFEGDKEWQALPAAKGETFAWDSDSTYVRKPPFFENLPATPAAPADIVDARVLALLGDSVTTDHISPAGAIAPDSPAGRYLQEKGVAAKDFNSYGSRRGNHEVMMRGTFANVRLRNLLAPGTEGGWSRHFPGGKQMPLYDAAMQYQKEGIPLVILAGKEYGTGSSRDWAAKGTYLLGVRAVLAQSFERIHRSNLIGMGVLPLVFEGGKGWKELGLTGEETISIEGISKDLQPRKILRAKAGDTAFQVQCRIDTPQEMEYYRAGGILQYVLRQLAVSR